MKASIPPRLALARTCHEFNASATLRHSSSPFLWATSQQVINAPHSQAIGTSRQPWKSPTSRVCCRYFSQSTRCLAKRSKGGNSASSSDAGSIGSSSKQPKDEDTNFSDPYDLSDMDTSYATLDTRFQEKLKQVQSGGASGVEAISNLRIRPDRDNPNASYPLRELAQINHRVGGRSVSIVVSDPAHIKPIMSAVQASADFNQQPQRDAENELELVMKLEVVEMEEKVRQVKAVVVQWRDAVREVLRVREKKVDGLVKGKSMGKDDGKMLGKKMKEMQDRHMKVVDAKEKEALQRLAASKTRL